MKALRSIILGIAALSGLVDPARAQSTQQPPQAASQPATQASQPLRFEHPTPASQDDQSALADAMEGPRTSWHVQFEPKVRYVGPAGDVSIPGAGSPAMTVDLADLDLNAPKLMPGFDLSLRRGRFRVNAIGLFYEIEDRTARADEAFALGSVAFAPGQRSSVDHDYAQIDFRFAYTLLDEAFRPLANRLGHRARVRVDAEAGLRIYDFEFEYENLDTGARGADDRTFFEPHAGFKASFDIFEELTVDLYTNFGAWPFDAQAYSWDIGVGFQWRPVDYFGLQIGYRSTMFLLNEGTGADEFEWNGSYQGLHAGIQFRF